jgi:cytochrome oxidase assembly protein ShyY1
MTFYDSKQIESKKEIYEIVKDLLEDQNSNNTELNNKLLEKFEDIKNLQKLENEILNQTKDKINLSNAHLSNISWTLLAIFLFIIYNFYIK